MRTYGRTRVRALASPRVYLVISILLSEQCICLCRRRKVFDELRRAVRRGRTMATGHYAFFFMHMYAYRMRARTDADADADAERNGTERNGGHRSREAGYKHLPITRPHHYSPRVVHVLAGALSFLNGGAR